MTKSIVAPDGSSHFLFKEGGQALQLSVYGASLLNPVLLLTDILVSPYDLKSRLRVHECFNHLHATGELPRRYFPVAPGAGRLGRVLRILDGWIAGASYREIALAVFGHDRVRNDWNNGHDYLKNYIRRAVSRGRQLMEGGYRQFLR